VLRKSGLKDVNSNSEPLIDGMPLMVNIIIIIIESLLIASSWQNDNVINEKYNAYGTLQKLHATRFSKKVQHALERLQNYRKNNKS